MMKAGGMEWALMDIGVELHWQGWRLEACIPRWASLFEVEIGSGQARTDCTHITMQHVKQGDGYSGVFG